MRKRLRDPPDRLDTYRCVCMCVCACMCVYVCAFLTDLRVGDP